MDHEHVVLLVSMTEGFPLLEWHMTVFFLLNEQFIHRKSSIIQCDKEENSM